MLNWTNLTPYVARHMIWRNMEIMYVNMLLQQNLFLFTTQHRTGSVDSVFELFKIVQYNLGIENYNIINIWHTVMNWKIVLISFSIWLSYHFTIVNPATTRMFNRKWNQSDHIREQMQRNINCIHKPSLIHKGHPPCRPIRNYYYKLKFNRS